MCATHKCVHPHNCTCSNNCVLQQHQLLPSSCPLATGMVPRTSVPVVPLHLHKDRVVPYVAGCTTFLPLKNRNFKVEDIQVRISAQYYYCVFFEIHKAQNFNFIDIYQIAHFQKVRSYELLVNIILAKDSRLYNIHQNS